MTNFYTDPYYKLINSAHENVDELKNNAKKSKVKLIVDFETGAFEGNYKDNNFKGSYTIEHTSAGFSKGFFYRVSLESLKKAVSASSEEDEFFDQIINCNKISIVPDKLSNPSYVILELAGNGKKITMIKFTKPSE